MYLDPSMSFEYGWVRMDMDMDTGTNMDTVGTDGYMDGLANASI